MGSPKKSCLMILFPVLLFFATGLVISAQDLLRQQGKIIELGNQFDPPAEIITVKTKIGRLEPNKPFLANEDWFKDIGVTIRNKYNQPFNYVSVSILIPRPEQKPEARDKTELDLVVPLEYGMSPFPLANGRIPVNSSTPIEPGKVVDFQLPAKVYDTIRNSMKDDGFPLNIRKVKIYVSMIGFVDGSVWMAGKFYIRDPNYPGKPSQFPGAGQVNYRHIP